MLTKNPSQKIPNTIFEIPAQENLSAIPNYSIMSDIGVEEIVRMDLSRPAYNLERNTI